MQVVNNHWMQNVEFTVHMNLNYCVCKSRCVRALNVSMLGAYVDVVHVVDLQTECTCRLCILYVKS